MTRTDGPTEPCDLPVVEARALLAVSDLSPTELVRSCLARIEAVEDRIHAWAHVDPEGAMAQARALEHGAAARDLPLWGVPVGVKDNIDVAELPCELNSPIYAGRRPAVDAAVVARLRAAGAVILGKTQCTVLSLFDPAPTRNPWKLAHTPGGSSSGSAAAVSSGMCPAALGSQVGGSTLRPAAYTGVVGYKPRCGRIALRGMVDPGGTLEHVGLLARRVDDVRALLAACVHGRAVARPGRERPPGLAVLAPDALGPVDAEASASLRATVRRVRAAGATIRELAPPPGFDAIPSLFRTVMTAGVADAYGDRVADAGPAVAALVAEGRGHSRAAREAAAARRLRLRAELAAWLRPFDGLLTPGATGPAPAGLASTGSAAMQVPWSFVGFPALCWPIGASRAGLPLAVQLVAAPSAEARHLDAARWCERQAGWRSVAAVIGA